MKLNELEIKILVELKKHHPNMTLAWMLNVSRDPEFKTSLELLRSLELVEVTWYGERDPSKPRHARITAEGLRLLRGLSDGENGERPSIGFDTDRPS